MLPHKGDSKVGIIINKPNRTRLQGGEIVITGSLVITDQITLCHLSLHLSPGIIFKSGFGCDVDEHFYCLEIDVDVIN